MKLDFKKIILLLSISILSLAVIVIFIGGGFGSNNTSTNTTQEPLLFAHRGLSKYFPENSVQAFDSCKSLGFKAIETDLRFTKDKKLVLFHDDSCTRLLGINKKIEALNWAELEYKPILHKGVSTNNRVVLLEQFFTNIIEDNIIYLDIKHPSQELADSLLTLLDRYQAHNTTLIADDNLFFLSYLKYKNAKVQTVLEGFNKGKEWLYYVIPKKFKPDYYASFLDKVDSSHIAFLQDNNLLSRKIVYGVNANNLSKTIKLKIQNVILDYEYSMGDYYNLKHLFSNN